MKARIKATGDIIDVSQTESIITTRGLERQYVDNQRKWCAYVQSELEFIHEKPQKDIDWEERRYEIAKQMLTVTSDYREKVYDKTTSQKICCVKAAKYAVEYADALIAELKKGGEK